MTVLLQVALGGAAGAVMRFLAGLVSVRLFGTAFPWGTLIVNVTGSFIIGIAATLLIARGAQGWSPLVMTGLLGGFTTFSAFSLDTAALVERGALGAAATYAFGTVALSFLAVAAGLLAGRAMT